MRKFKIQFEVESTNNNPLADFVDLVKNQVSETFHDTDIVKNFEINEVEFSPETWAETLLHYLQNGGTPEQFAQEIINGGQGVALPTVEFPKGEFDEIVRDNFADEAWESDSDESEDCDEEESDSEIPYSGVTIGQVHPDNIVGAVADVLGISPSTIEETAREWGVNSIEEALEHPQMPSEAAEKLRAFIGANNNESVATETEETRVSQVQGVLTGEHLDQLEEMLDVSFEELTAYLSRYKIYSLYQAISHIEEVDPQIPNIQKVLQYLKGQAGL